MVDRNDPAMRSTMLGVQFVSDLIAFMLAHGLTKRVLPGTDVPVNFLTFPVRIAKYDKIIKVLRQLADSEEESDADRFEVYDQSSDRMVTVSFRVDREHRHTVVEIEPAAG